MNKNRLFSIDMKRLDSFVDIEYKNIDTELAMDNIKRAFK